MVRRRGFNIYLALFKCNDEVIKAMFYERPEPLMFLETDNGEYQLCKLVRCKKIRFHPIAVLAAIRLASQQWKELREFLEQKFEEMERSLKDQGDG